MIATAHRAAVDRWEVRCNDVRRWEMREPFVPFPFCVCARPAKSDADSHRCFWCHKPATAAASLRLLDGGNEPRIYLKPEPLCLALEAWIAVHERDDWRRYAIEGTDRLKSAVTVLSERSGVNARNIWNLLDRKQGRVERGVARRLAEAMDVGLADVYGAREAVAA